MRRPLAIALLAVTSAGAQNFDTVQVRTTSGARPDTQNRLKQTPLDVVKRTRGDHSPAALLLRQLMASASTSNAAPAQ